MKGRLLAIKTLWTHKPLCKTFAAVWIVDKKSFLLVWWWWRQRYITRTHPCPVRPPTRHPHAPLMLKMRTTLQSATSRWFPLVERQSAEGATSPGTARRSTTARLRPEPREKSCSRPFRSSATASVLRAAPRETRVRVMCDNEGRGRVRYAQRHGPCRTRPNADLGLVSGTH